MVIISNESFGKQPGQSPARSNCILWNSARVNICSALDSIIEYSFIIGILNWPIELQHLVTSVHFIKISWSCSITRNTAIDTWSCPKYISQIQCIVQIWPNVLFEYLLTQKVPQNWQLILIISPIYPLYRLIWLPMGHLDYSLFPKSPSSFSYSKMNTVIRVSLRFVLLRFLSIRKKDYSL